MNWLSSFVTCMVCLMYVYTVRIPTIYVCIHCALSICVQEQTLCTHIIYTQTFLLCKVYFNIVLHHLILLAYNVVFHWFFFRYLKDIDFLIIFVNEFYTQKSKKLYLVQEIRNEQLAIYLCNIHCRTSMCTQSYCMYSVYCVYTVNYMCALHAYYVCVITLNIIYVYSTHCILYVCALYVY